MGAGRRHGIEGINPPHALRPIRVWIGDKTLSSATGKDQQVPEAVLRPRIQASGTRSRRRGLASRLSGPASARRSVHGSVPRQAAAAPAVAWAVRRRGGDLGAWKARSCPVRSREGRRSVHGSGRGASASGGVRGQTRASRPHGPLSPSRPAAPRPTRSRRRRGLPRGGRSSPRRPRPASRSAASGRRSPPARPRNSSPPPW